MSNKCTNQNIASFIGWMKDSEHRGRKVCIQMEENLTIFMKIDSLPSTIISKLTFSPKACSSSLYLRAMYK